MKQTTILASLLCMVTSPLLGHANPLSASFNRRQEQQTPGSWEVSGHKDDPSSPRSSWNDLKFDPLEPQSTDTEHSILRLTLSKDAQAAPSSDILWQTLTPYLKREDRQVYLAFKDGQTDLCNDKTCFQWQSCDWFYKCFFETIAFTKDRLELAPGVFNSCIDPKSIGERQCYLFFRDPRYDVDQSTDCTLASSIFPGSDGPKNWELAHVDDAIQTILHGGWDSSSGLYWLAPAADFTFLSQIGRRVLDQESFSCSLQAPCDKNWDCKDIETRWQQALGKVVSRSKTGWVFSSLALLLLLLSSILHPALIQRTIFQALVSAIPG